MSMRVVGGVKGGPGKTTIVTNVAAMRAHDSGSDDLLLVDVDNIKESVIWGNRRPADVPRVIVEEMSGGEVFKRLRERSARFKDILVDAGGHDSKELRSSLMVADEMIVPMRASQHDYDVVPKLDDLLKEINDIRADEFQLPPVHVRVLVVQAPENQERSKRAEVIGIVEHFNTFHEVLETVTTYRPSSYSACQTYGMGVIEFAKSREVALREMKRLHQEIWK